MEGKGHTDIMDTSSIYIDQADWQNVTKLTITTMNTTAIITNMVSISSLILITMLTTIATII